MIDTTKRFYISGPITGEDPGMVQMAFRNAADRLYKAGVESVIDPYSTIGRMGHIHEEYMTLTIDRDTLSHDEFMHVCISALQLCGALLLLPGWRKSSGCCMETGAAIERGLDIYELQPDGSIEAVTF